MFSDLLNEIKNGEPDIEKWDAINYLIKLKSFYNDKIRELLRSNQDNKAFYTGLKTEYDLLMEKYNLLYKKWEEFSKCLDKGPEKFISMLDDLKEKIKSKGNEIVQLREQLKTSELDANRYRNDGIQDRVKLQEVTEELESMIKMRDNWKADCEYNEKCFQAERDRRWELEEEVKQLKKQIQQLVSVLDEVCPRHEIDMSPYIKSKKELDELIEKRLSIFEDPRLSIENRWDGYCSIDLINGNKIKFIDMVKGYLDKDALSILDMRDNYIICDNRTGNYLYKIDKETYNIEKISHLKFETIDDADCSCPCKKCRGKKTQIYLTIGLHKVLVDTVDYEVDYHHYRLYEDSQKCCIIKKDDFRRDFKNYSIDKETLKVKVID